VISKSVGDAFNYSIFDHQLMLKGLPFVGYQTEAVVKKAKMDAEVGAGERCGQCSHPYPWHHCRASSVASQPRALPPRHIPSPDTEALQPSPVSNQQQQQASAGISRHQQASVAIRPPGSSR
jgi:uncharacterized iron-regulated membrane protein